MSSLLAWLRVNGRALFMANAEKDGESGERARERERARWGEGERGREKGSDRRREGEREGETARGRDGEGERRREETSDLIERIIS